MALNTWEQYQNVIVNFGNEGNYNCLYLYDNDSENCTVTGYSITNYIKHYKTKEGFDNKNIIMAINDETLVVKKEIVSLNTNLSPNEIPMLTLLLQKGSLSFN